MQKKSITTDLEILTSLPVKVDYLLLKDRFSNHKNTKKKVFDLRQKGYLQQIKRGLYFNTKSKEIENTSYEVIANSLYFPSYVSMEWALQHYGLIMDRVNTITSVTTLRSKNFETPYASLSYTHIAKKRYPIGYTAKIINRDQSFLIAKPEKALIDYINIKAKNLVITKDSDIQDFLENDIRIDLVEFYKSITLQDLNELIPFYHRNSKEHRILKWLAKQKKEAILSTPIDSLIARYNPVTVQDYENALKEIIQEITLAGLAKTNFYEKAAFYGGTALRVFYDLPRFSEDLDFTLLSEQSDFSLKHYFSSVTDTLKSFGFEVIAEEVDKKVSTDVESAFLKANTKIHLLKISSGQKFADKIQANKKMSIKFEVDTTPSLGFETEVKILTPPITSSIKVLKLPYLFSGKMHAILFRKWATRIKGRDFYDLLWYIGQKTPVNLSYLESKMRDGNTWTENKKLTKEDLLELLEIRIDTIDFKAASQDVVTFIKNPGEVSDWTRDFFKIAIKNLRFE